MNKYFKELRESMFEAIDKHWMELSEIINTPGTTWKIRRAVIKKKYGLPDDVIENLVPEPSEGMELHPSDY